MKIPQKGMRREELTSRLEAMRAGDANRRALGNRSLFSLVYPTRPDVDEVAREAYLAFFSENALNPMAFPSLRAMETDVIRMTLAMLHAPDGAAGSMSSGGSESILLAVKTARDWARAERPHVTAPKVILPITAHPAFLKAAHLVGVEPVIVPTTPALTVDVDAVKRALTDDTILIVGSAPQYPHGVVDPIAELGALASARGILMHVDACIGGFVLPWVERLGHPVPAFDFRVPGVTSISADLHKYGFAAKGASTVLYRTRELRKHQFFAHGDWPGGLFVSPSILGTRPGGAIAAAWSVMNYLGEEGYLALTEQAWRATQALMDAVRRVPGLTVMGEPTATLFAIGLEHAPGSEPPLDLYVLAERMEARGFSLDKQHAPPSLHLTVSPGHAAVKDAFAEALADSAREAREAKARGEQPQGSAAMYGMLGSLPDRGAVTATLLEFLSHMDAT